MTNEAIGWLGCRTTAETAGWNCWGTAAGEVGPEFRQQGLWDLAEKWKRGFCAKRNRRSTRPWKIPGWNTTDLICWFSYQQRNLVTILETAGILLLRDTKNDLNYLKNLVTLDASDSDCSVFASWFDFVVVKYNTIQTDTHLQSTWAEDSVHCILLSWFWK